jgi:glycosyltransferase involved in cell wall biosynthesis
MTNPRLTIVVPCYREQGVLAELHQRISRAAQTAQVGDDFELILVNDGSPDGTWAGICALGDIDPRVVGVNLSRNHGHQLALSAGLSLARGERIFMLDADLQDPPELLTQMMQALDAGADVAYGQRTQRIGESLFKRASAAIFYRLLNRLSDVRIPQDAGDFRLISRRVLEVLKDMPESHRYVRGMVSWVGFRQVAIPYQRQPRTSGTSGYPLRKMLRLAFDAITGFSTRPLRLASLLGVAFGCLGALGVVVTISAWAMGATVPGWASVVVILLTLGGIQLAVLGIIGEYLGRLYVEVKRRPLYVIDEIRTRH